MLSAFLKTHESGKDRVSFKQGCMQKNNPKSTVWGQKDMRVNRGQFALWNFTLLFYYKKIEEANTKVICKLKVPAFLSVFILFIVVIS